MSFFSCKGCKAKDEEIARLWSLVGQLSAPVDTRPVRTCPKCGEKTRERDVCPHCGGLLEMWRDFVKPPEPTPPDPDPLPKVIDEALGKKYEVNSRDWRSERRAARQLVNEGMDPEAVAILVAKGQPTERW